MDRQLKLPNKIISFQMLRENNFIYVDKTAKFEKLINGCKGRFLARPKGFGKTLLLSTLTSLFSGKAELFEGLAVYELAKQYAEHPYPVLNFDFASLNGHSLEEFKLSFENMIINTANNFGITLQYPLVYYTSISSIFRDISKRSKYFVVLIDNYEKPILDCIGDTELLFEVYHDLDYIYSFIYRYINSIKFVMVTGVERYRSKGVFSTGEMTDDISYSKHYGDILGYTQEELENNFAGYIDQQGLDITSKDFFEQLKSHNDQFCFDGITNVYNPCAINESLEYLNVEKYISCINDNQYTPFKYKCINPGDELFLQAKNSEIYVDKSELLITINKFINDMDRKYICVTRPPRFGKTTDINMIAAYYDITCDARKTFAGLKITEHKSFLKFSNSYFVIKISMKDYINITDIDSLIQKLQEDITNDLLRHYGNRYRSDSLIRFIDSVASDVIVLIDDYDLILRTYKDKLDWQKRYLDFLCYLLKDKPYISLAYITGVLPVKKYGTHSGLDFFDYTMADNYAFSEFVGFPESEVENLCKRYNRDFNKCKEKYDGYEVEKTSHIYNPECVLGYLKSGEFKDYWNISDGHKTLKTYLSSRKYPIAKIIKNLLEGNSYTINPEMFLNDMVSFESAEQILILLVHLGYLSYDYRTSEVKIPNADIAADLIKALSEFDPKFWEEQSQLWSENKFWRY